MNSDIGSQKRLGFASALAGVQRSMVDGLLYAFSEPVKLNATTAFSIIFPDGQTGTVSPAHR